MIDEIGLLVLVAVEPESFLPASSPRRCWTPTTPTRLPPDCAACLEVSRRGDPAEVLSEVAREHRADLVMVGRRGRDFAARMLLGSVAGRLIVGAPCDVLVVH